MSMGNSKSTSSEKYREYVPHASLQDHVKCFWTMERAYTPDHPAEDVTPDAFIELILNFGDPYVLQVEGALDREIHQAIVVVAGKDHIGPTESKVRNTTHFGLARFAAARSCSMAS
jgi:hypothetical protein